MAKLTERQKEYNKAMRKADFLITKAIEEKLQKGIRENLGYDSYNKLSDFMGKLEHLTYSDKAEISYYFNCQCDTVVNR